MTVLLHILNTCTEGNIYRTFIICWSQTNGSGGSWGQHGRVGKKLCKNFLVACVTVGEYLLDMIGEFDFLNRVGNLVMVEKWILVSVTCKFLPVQTILSFSAVGCANGD